MNKIAIIIPSRLAAERLPNKPLKLINNKEMILHVYDTAIKAQIGEVYVATPDHEIYELLKKHGGKAIKTQSNHQTGTDRIFEVFEKELQKKTDLIINLQGDMPNLRSSAINNLVQHMGKKTCDIGTLASKFKDKKEEKNPDVVKVVVEKKIKTREFASAVDFFRLSSNPISNATYHHIGIYAFTNKALIRYVGLKRSKLEIKRKLEQLRALDNEMKIEVGYLNSSPLSVDTEQDLKEVKRIMEN
tara:strand:+ start:109 stop:843 length:735 start_codon:yes stop_codon:yes gene_type:complete